MHARSRTRDMHMHSEREDARGRAVQDRQCTAGKCCAAAAGFRPVGGGGGGFGRTERHGWVQRACAGGFFAPTSRRVLLPACSSRLIRRAATEP
jgi:hypothetical protein